MMFVGYSSSRSIQTNSLLSFPGLNPLKVPKCWAVMHMFVMVLRCCPHVFSCVSVLWTVLVPIVSSLSFPQALIYSPLPCCTVWPGWFFIIDTWYDTVSGGTSLRTHMPAAIYVFLSNSWEKKGALLWRAGWDKAQIGRSVAIFQDFIFNGF